MRTLEWFSALSALWWGLALALALRWPFVMSGSAAGQAMIGAEWIAFLTLTGAGHVAGLLAPANGRLSGFRFAAAAAAAAVWSFVAVMLLRGAALAACGPYAGLAVLNFLVCWGMWRESDL
ncbi:hypothetical protein [Marinivivus vitaminiproducens]|uniref:hypothetical protein n=1 Tax=Marinivivus vitaminiproducens TaxID=3035935 RepID=UPI0027A4BD72|nr:hypothetical protein P4R82_14360 [Geminicoccaceae bacterium SCSIO 64248]